ncbi:MAG: hypothetical protein AB7F75_00835 [Planctomycetota bacterium]
MTKTGRERETYEGRTPMRTRYEHEKRDLERFAKNIAAWARDGKRWAARGDREMAETHERDVLALKAVHAAVLRGDYREAAKLAYPLDTIVRDQIPARLYNAINQ